MYAKIRYLTLQMSLGDESLTSKRLVMLVQDPLSSLNPSLHRKCPSWGTLNMPWFNVPPDPAPPSTPPSTPRPVHHDIFLKQTKPKRPLVGFKYGPFWRCPTVFALLRLTVMSAETAEDDPNHSLSTRFLLHGAGPLPPTSSVLLDLFKAYPHHGITYHPRHPAQLYRDAPMSRWSFVASRSRQALHCVRKSAITLFRHRRSIIPWSN
ncbi:hypothetical protein B0T13DRAFT_297855 [Neurospora crassa]|nr:hypothetical protein B0T13DRAFT_297855 [Neurospora crassa]